jgi:hypothetical protein
MPLLLGFGAWQRKLEGKDGVVRRFCTVRLDGCRGEGQQSYTGFVSFQETV